MKQEMKGCQWHQLHHMQIICTSLETDNHASTSSLSFYRPDALPDAQPTASNSEGKCQSSDNVFSILMQNLNTKDKSTTNQKHWDSAYLCQDTIIIIIQHQYRDPDHHENLIICSLAHCQPSQKLSCKSVQKFLCKVANRETTTIMYPPWWR